MAVGDGPLWNPENPRESMFSVYSTSAVGLFGAMVETTDVEGIIRVNCNATDFYAHRPFPVYLMYNPFQEATQVSYTVDAGRKDLFDIVSRTYLAKGVRGSARITLPADASAVVVELPAGSRIRRDEAGNLTVNNHIISYEKAN